VVVARGQGAARFEVFLEATRHVDLSSVVARPFGVPSRCSARLPTRRFQKNSQRHSLPPRSSIGPFRGSLESAEEWYGKHGRVKVTINGVTKTVENIYYSNT